MLSETTHGEDMMRPGHAACPGCGLALGMRLVLRALGPHSVVVVVPSCAAVIAGPFPTASMKMPVFHSAFEIAAPTAAGISNALKMQGKDDIPVLAFAGDGGTYDIGFQSLSGAASRNDDFIYVCLDNEGYMNTGIQVSSATPRHAWTRTSPKGNPHRKKQIMEIMAAHYIPYAATASIGFPDYLMQKVQRAKEIRGTRFIHLLSPCQTGWKTAEDVAARVAVAAVESKMYPLYEIRDGRHYTLTHQSRGVPVQEFLNLQGRFRHLDENTIREIQQESDRDYLELEEKAARADA